MPSGPNIEFCGAVADHHQVVVAGRHIQGVFGAVAGEHLVVAAGIDVAGVEVAVAEDHEVVVAGRGIAQEADIDGIPLMAGGGAGDVGANQRIVRCRATLGRGDDRRIEAGAGLQEVAFSGANEEPVGSARKIVVAVAADDHVLVGDLTDCIADG